MHIVNFITNRFFSEEVVNFVFQFWSPYAKRKIEIDVVKNHYFCNALIKGDYEAALGVVTSHFALYDWFKNSSCEVFEVNKEKKIISLKPEHRNCGYSPAEYNLFFTVACATVLWQFLRDDYSYRVELDLGKESSNKIVQGLFRVIQHELPEYNIYSNGYNYVA